jgi:hypothetical protein
MARIEELEAKAMKASNAALLEKRRADEAEAKLAKAVETLLVIGALNPAGLIDNCPQTALRGLVLAMGGIASTTLAELKEKTDE